MVITEEEFREEEGDEEKRYDIYIYIYIYIFGDTRKFSPMGATVMVGYVRIYRDGKVAGTKEVPFQVDIIDDNIPLLVSRRSLQELGSIMNFVTNQIMLKDG